VATGTGAENRVRFYKRLRSPGIDSKEAIRQPMKPNRFVLPARQAGNQFLGSLKGLQIRALGSLQYYINKIKVICFNSILSKVNSLAHP
jgi:hypothetical protein